MPYPKRRLHLHFHPTTMTHRHNDYWKLRHPENMTVHRLKHLLERRGYATGRITEKDWLIDSLIRADLGCMFHVPYSNDELMQFINDRGIDASEAFVGKSQGWNKELICLLDEADQMPEFHRFLELPAELRNRIYAMHFSTFEQPLMTATQPPLTLTNRQIRAETLEMFYGSMTLRIDLCLQNKSSFTNPTTRNIKVVIPREVFVFFHSVQSRHLALIRHFSFHLDAKEVVQRAGPVDALDDPFWFDVDLPSDGDNAIDIRFAEGPLYHE